MAPARDRRTGFSRRRQYGAFIGYVLAIAGAVVGAVLLVASTFDPPAFAALRMTLATVTVPVSSVLAAGLRTVATVPETIGTYVRVHGENEELRGEVKRSRALLMQARTVAYDNRRLRRLLAIRDRTIETVVVARLVSSSASSGRRFALLDAGFLQGVRSGMPVQGPTGLIGRVTEIGPIAARILLLIDPESVIPVRRIGDGLPAIASGRGDGRIDIRAAERTNVGFRRGDVFVTSGVGGLYAPGVPVAKVVSTGIDQSIATPFAPPDSLDYALVQRPFMPLPPAQSALATGP